MSRDDLIVEEIQYENYKIKIMYDDCNDDMSPREWDNLGTMLCWHRNYNLGDEHPLNKGYGPDENLDYIKELEGDLFILDLYLYDHSGITMSTGSFHDIFDSGQVGFIYVSKKKVREEYKVKRISKQLEKKVYDILESEVKTYDQYLRGEVYGFVVEDEDENVVYSCWGFYEKEYCIEEAKISVKYIYENNIGNGVGI